jgi:S1-C subfamily serine protease
MAGGSAGPGQAGDRDPGLAALTIGAAGAQAPGIGFAISSNRARFIADQLIKSGVVTNPGRTTAG